MTKKSKKIIIIARYIYEKTFTHLFDGQHEYGSNDRDPDTG